MEKQVSYINEGLHHIKNKNYFEAIEIFNSVIKSDIEPMKKYEAYVLLGSVYDEFLMYDKAIECYSNATTFNTSPDFLFYYKKGVCLFNQNKFKEAINSLNKFEEAINSLNKKNKIPLDKKYFFAFVTKGISEFNLSRYVDAIETLDKAIKLDSDYASSYYNKAYCLYRLENYEGALKQALLAKDKGLNNFNLYNLLGLINSKLKNYTKALVNYNQAMSFDNNNNNPNLYLNIGHCYYNLNMHSKAVKAFDKAILLDPNEVLFSDIRQIIIERNQNNSIEKELSKLYESNEKFFNIRKYKEYKEDQEINRLLSNSKIDGIKKSENEMKINDISNNEKQFLDHIKLGINFFKENKYKEAIENYEKAKNIYPTKPFSYIKIGEIYQIMQKHDLAIAMFKKAIEYDAKNFSTYISLGESFFIQARYKEALECFNLSININPNNSSAYHYKAETLYRMDNYIESIDNLKQAIEIMPSSYLSYYLKGKILLKFSKYSDALECFNQTIKLNPNYHLAYDYKGQALQNLNLDEEAIKSFDIAITYFSFYPSYLNKAESLSRLNRVDEATKCFDEAAKLMPDYFLCYYSKAIFYFKQKQYDLALPLFDKAIELNSNYLAYHCKGEIFQIQKNYEFALKFYKKSIEMGGNFYLTYIKLAEISMLNNDYLKAKEYIEHSIDLNENCFLSYYYHGIICEKFNDLNKSLNFYTKANELNPKNSHLINAKNRLSKIELMKEQTNFENNKLFKGIDNFDKAYEKFGFDSDNLYDNSFLFDFSYKFDYEKPKIYENEEIKTIKKFKFDNLKRNIKQ